jgi:hypothetical protein
VQGSSLFDRNAVLRRVLAPLFDGVRLWVVLILTVAGVGIIGAYPDVLVAWIQLRQDPSLPSDDFRDSGETVEKS